MCTVPSAPADIKAVTSGDNSVLVSWRPPNSPNGRIQKYTVYRREVINGEEVEKYVQRGEKSFLATSPSSRWK